MKPTISDRAIIPGYMSRPCGSGAEAEKKWLVSVRKVGRLLTFEGGSTGRSSTRASTASASSTWWKPITPGPSRRLPTGVIERALPCSFAICSWGLAQLPMKTLIPAARARSKAHGHCAQTMRGKSSCPVTASPRGVTPAPTQGGNGFVVSAPPTSTRSRFVRAITRNRYSRRGSSDARPDLPTRSGPEAERRDHAP